jgi:lipid A 3-O-deacylase
MSRVGNAAAVALAAGVWCVSPIARADDPGLVAVGAGAFDFLHTEAAAELRGEYRFAHGFYFLKPLVGAFATSRGGVYSYGGVRADFVFADHYVVMPVAAVGYYRRGNGEDLGSAFEFKTGAEFAYRLDGGTRVGVAFDHISNAGLAKRNPGEENLLWMLSLPIGGAP